MNDPNKRINVNISSLLSLKAELLRKQEEVSKAKVKQTSEPFVPKKSSKPNRNEKTEEQRNHPSEDNVTEYEDSALLDKSRKILESKSRFYDKMAASGGALNSDDNCLVLFNQKKQDSKPEEYNFKKSSNNSSGDDDDDDDNDNTSNPDEEWVEYTDCLGRTRKCLKKDLEFFKKKDNQLAENIQPRIELNQNAPMWMIDNKPSLDHEVEKIRDDISEMTSVMSKHDQMKMNWEKKEEENIYKENVHYQDVLFDEARQHGVGYYAFSTDEDERAKQRKALDELREKTLAEQKQREIQRQQKENIIKERVKAAKNRQRARQGLPPLEDEPEPTIPEKPYDTKEEEKRKKKEEKERRKKEKQEKLREFERKNHIRPWDRNKDGVNIEGRKNYPSGSDDDDNDEWEYRPEKEPMSQEQWNEMKRNERNMEFAPQPEVMPSPQPPPPMRSFRSQPTSDIPSDGITTLQETLFFTTKKQHKNSKPKEFIRKNYSSTMGDDKRIGNVGVPIQNELESNDFDSNEKKKVSLSSGGGAQIPPPPTYEYYGPSSSKRSKLPPKKDLEESIEAGLRFIRERADKGVLPVKSSWTANASNADY